MTLRKRLSALEAKEPMISRAWHRIIQEPDQNEDDAINVYGRDRIAADDNILLWVIVEPKARMV
ncbi:MAG TPA: hypothetical protein PLQ12_11685 [Candidatus Defluviicoccus seviourii]|nr:hypothetical protein [Candidatus Defluviicoccus seviourii]